VTGPGSAVSSRRELAEARPGLMRLLPIAVVGSAVGSVLLLLTPPGAFAQLVPFLVAGGSVVLIVQPALMKLRKRSHGGGAARAVLLVGVVSVYGGYFGAGSGVMLLAVVLVLVDSRIPSANAIKNMLVAITSLTAAAVFMVSEPVPWNAVLPLAAGLLVGSAVGPIIVRVLPPNVVRWFAAACGLFLAAYLWLRPTIMAGGIVFAVAPESYVEGSSNDIAAYVQLVGELPHRESVWPLPVGSVPRTGVDMSAWFASDGRVCGSRRPRSGGEADRTDFSKAGETYLNRKVRRRTQPGTSRMGLLAPTI
jgi:uncharacterized protein